MIQKRTLKTKINVKAKLCPKKIFQKRRKRKKGKKKNLPPDPDPAPNRKINQTPPNHHVPVQVIPSRNLSPREEKNQIPEIKTEKIGEPKTEKKTHWTVGKSMIPKKLTHRRNFCKNLSLKKRRRRK